MSAAATATVKDANLQLIREMGGNGSMGWDPVPEAQLLAPLTQNATLSATAQKLHAKMFEKTVVRLKRGFRSAFATNDGKTALSLKDLADELGWALPKMSKYWGELKDAGYVRRTEDGRLYLNANVEPTKVKRRREPAAEVTQETLDAFLRYQRHYIWEQYQVLEPEARNQTLRLHYDAEEHIKLVKADAMHGARDYGEEYLDRVLQPHGIVIRRQEDKEDDRPRLVQIIVRDRPQDDAEEAEQLSVQTTPDPDLESSEEAEQLSVQTTPEVSFHVPQLSVQLTPDESVQAAKPMLYNVKSEVVHDSYPYVTENRESRVSKYEDAGAEDATAATDLPTPTLTETLQTPTPAEQTAAPLSFETLAASKTFSVDKAKSIEANPILRTVGKYFGKVTNPKLRSQFLQLADENDLPSEAVARFLTEKMNEKISKGEKVFSAGALFQYASSDIRGWMNQNRPYLARIVEQEQRQAAPAVSSPPPEPAEPILDPAELQEQIRACEQLAADAKHRDFFLKRAEELKAQLRKLAAG